MLGRPNQSPTTRHRGRRLGLSEREIFTPHPPVWFGVEKGLFSIRRVEVKCFQGSVLPSR
jgi:hypothetical protein